MWTVGGGNFQLSKNVFSSFAENKSRASQFIQPTSSVCRQLQVMLMCGQVQHTCWWHSPSGRDVSWLSFMFSLVRHFAREKMPNGILLIWLCSIIIDCRRHKAKAGDFSVSLYIQMQEEPVRVHCDACTARWKICSFALHVSPFFFCIGLGKMMDGSTLLYDWKRSQYQLCGATTAVAWVHHSISSAPQTTPSCQI